MPIEIGTLLESRYQIESLIGEGGTADVFLATDIVKKTSVAIKALKDDLSKNESVLENFKKEVTILSCLSSEHIVRVYGYYFYENKPYIVNEYVKGNTLKDLLDNRGMLSPYEAVDYMIQLTQALMPAHAKGVIHRDIKPLNIFVLNDGTLKLADFGIAETTERKTISDTKTIVGSVHYLAPEISLGKPVTIASDIYSCGIVFYEMLTGQVPFDRDTPVQTALAHVKEKIPSVRNFLPDISKEIEKIITICTKKKPNDRYKNIGELYNDLCSVKNNGTYKTEKFGLFGKKREDK